MNIFLVNEDHEHGKSLMLKLSKSANPGAIIPLSQGEMDLYRSDDFSIISLSQENNPQIIEVNPTKKYVCVADPDKTVIDDIVNINELMGMNIGIIRVTD